MVTRTSTKMVTWLAISLVIAIVFISSSRASEAERKLMTDLFRRYDRNVRPVLNSNETVNVQITHTIKQILDVDEGKEQFITSGWCNLVWSDIYLSWQPSHHHGITSISINPKQIWLPDIVLDGNVQTVMFGSDIDQLRNLVTIDYHGNVLWTLRGTFITLCHFNIHDFPFDLQSCALQYGSWSYEKGKLDISPTSTLKVEFGPSHYAWRVLNYSSEISKREFVGGVYETITFSVTFKRRALCHIISKLLPPMIVGILVLFSFLIPIAAGGRLTFSVTLLLAMIFFMVSTTRLIPRDDASVPIIYLFFISTLMEILLLHLLLIYSLTIHYKTSYDPPMPPWMRHLILDKLSYAMGTRTRREQNGSRETLKNEDVLDIIEIGLIADEDEYERKEKKKKMKGEDGNHGNYCNHSDEKEKEMVLREWRVVAMTIDRFLFVVFSTIFLVILFVFCINATF